MYYIACDPAGSKYQAFSILDDDKQLVAIKSIKMGSSLRNNCKALTELSDWIQLSIGMLPYKAIVESQEIYKGQAHKQKSIIKLANYAGMAAQCLAIAGNCKSIEFVLPRQWTNQEKKKSQFWICKKMGWTPEPHSTYCVPKDGILGETRVTVLADIMDAVGIALYLFDKDKTAKRRKDILNG